ncbi:MAG: hypothetical protein AAF092_04740 [Pseudomonadota bacterium]
MNRVTRIAALTVALGLTAGTATSAQDSQHMQLVENGIAINGLSLQGLTLQGLTLQGLTLQGLTTNGTYFNGRFFNGIELQGLNSNGTALHTAVVNPFEGLDRAPLGQ